MSVRSRLGVHEDAEPTGPLAGVVTALSTTPVKGLRLHRRSEVTLTRAGVPDNRRFVLIDETGRPVNGKRLGKLAAVRADYEPSTGSLELTFPDGSWVAGEVSGADEDELAQALSDYAGQPVRLVEADSELGGADRGLRGVVSLISRASVDRLSRYAGEAVDARRLRMLIEVVGPSAREEATLVGAQTRIGDALVSIHGHAGAFGVYGEVLEPGAVKLGDSVYLEALA
jgi:uncharacterized protein